MTSIDEPILAEVVDHPPVAVLNEPRDAVVLKRPGLGRRIIRGLGLAAEWLFGAVALILGLAILAAIPVLQFLSLGYLLEAAGRVGRTGRITAGLVGFRKAARVGSILIGTWLWLLPIQLVASMWRSARLVDPGGVAQSQWGWGLAILSVLIGIHLIGAYARGGRFRHFLFPIINPFRVIRRLRRGHLYRGARDAVWEFVVALRLKYYFWLGLRGFAGAVLWLALPVTLLVLAPKVPPLGFLGGALLILALFYLPFLQTHFAAERRFSAMFEVRTVRRLFVRAPIAFWFALAATLILAVPLYLLKIEMIPREAAWLPSLAFVLFIYPGRLLCGWAYARGRRREKPRFWLFRYMSRLAMLPPVLVYVIILFFTQYTAWYGVWSLYEQHAFLVPVPFLGM